ncbi:MAG: Ni/Fe hydrogenase subunit alpha [Deltaproteobacteria bacterium]|nr:Ni/Fe hydrogenase subunit alpha [Deltaproteobacteria bacterium]MBN2670936.1 Ni/Fe hydrogenase subunit alpha [Deltaproteobacteria bacterium]
MRTIVIDPITRLEGHGKISIFLNDAGNVEKALFQVPELRGFEAFTLGRPAVDMPQITSRICGVCPTTHHMASTKALDDLYGVEPTPAAKAIRELVNSAFICEDHTLHFYILAGADFVVGPDAPAALRNILGVISKVGAENGAYVIEMRKKIRKIIEMCAGKPVHPVFGLPGGVSKRVTEEMRKEFQQISKEAVEFAKFTLKIFHDAVLGNKDYVSLITGDVYYHETNHMGMIDANGKVNLYDGNVRVVDPTGQEVVTYAPRDYHKIIGEHVEDWTYIKFPFLREKGWQGFVDGKDSGVYRVAPLARLNVSTGMATPRAQAEYEKMYATLGGQVSNHTLANHWARLIELMYCAERMVELSDAPELTFDETRNMNFQTPAEGVGIVEAPRGTLIHHYQTDEKGMMTGCNLIVATVSNAAIICMGIEKAAKKLIRDGNVDDGLLNMVEMTFRSYDPCLSCATHALGQTPLKVEFVEPSGEIRHIVTRR